MGLILTCALAFALMNLVSEAQSAAMRSQCLNNLKQIGLGLHNYLSSNDRFPPAYNTDSSGRPLVSWRVLISPFMEQWGGNEEPGSPPPPPAPWSHLDQPWDSPLNLALGRAMPAYWACPSHGDRVARGLTSYVMITGRGTAFSDGRSRSLADLAGSTQDTVLVVEVANVDIPWMAPRDLDIDEMSSALNDPARPGVSSAHGPCPHALMADGSVKTLDRPFTAAEVRAMFKNRDRSPSGRAAD
jgi:hypothetical protein